MTFTVQISVGNGKHPWRPVSVDAYHDTLEAAVERVDHGGGRYSWVRIVDENGNQVPIAGMARIIKPSQNSKLPG